MPAPAPPAALRPHPLVPLNGEEAGLETHRSVDAAPTSTRSKPPRRLKAGGVAGQLHLVVCDSISFQQQPGSRWHELKPLGGYTAGVMRYASNLTDAEWALIAPFIPAPAPHGRPAPRHLGVDAGFIHIITNDSSDKPAPFFLRRIGYRRQRSVTRFVGAR